MTYTLILLQANVVNRIPAIWTKLQCTNTISAFYSTAVITCHDYYLKNVWKIKGDE